MQLNFSRTPVSILRYALRLQNWEEELSSLLLLLFSTPPFLGQILLLRMSVPFGTVLPNFFPIFHINFRAETFKNWRIGLSSARKRKKRAIGTRQIKTDSRLVSLSIRTTDAYARISRDLCETEHRLTLLCTWNIRHYLDLCAYFSAYAIFPSVNSSIDSRSVPVVFIFSF